MGTDLSMHEILEQMANRLMGLETEVVRLRAENDRKDTEIDDLKKEMNKRWEKKKKLENVLDDDTKSIF